MAQHDYIPASHDGFFVWQNDFYNGVSEKMSSFKINADKLKPLTEAQIDYLQAFARASNPDGANSADRVERNEREAAYKTAIRQFVNECIRFNSDVSDSEKKSLGLTVRDTKRTPVPLPETHPVIEIDFSETRVHKLRIKDEFSDKYGKPYGVRECEVWVKVGGEMPRMDSEMTLAGSSSNGKLRLTYTKLAG